jgi:CubicO group peptidase (beta-lactamase class C family)
MGVSVGCVRGAGPRWAWWRMCMAILLCVGSSLSWACAAPSSVPLHTPQPTAVPAYWPADEWRTSTPEEQGMDSARLQQMMDYLDGASVPLHAVIVIRHGYTVWEEYRNGYRAERSQDLQSVTKSFTSTLIGIAIRQGLIQDVQQRMVDLFPDYKIANMDARKERITVEHLLTMSEGMDWHELDYPYDDSRNTLGQMWTSKDAVQHVLDRPMAREPGESWSYNSGTSILLGGIIEEVTGGNPASFAEEYLFKPIGVSGFYWAKTTGGHYHTDGALYLLPRDMARLGYLMLHHGTWDGQEIVTSDWVAEATREHYRTTSPDGYGYQWWTVPSSQAYRATGHYGQMIYVVPEADMVVVFTADIPDGDPYPHDALVFRYILEACRDLPYEALHKRYAGYGWSAEYPAGFRVDEVSTGDAPQPSAAAGMVQFLFVGYPYDSYIVAWHEAEPDADLGSYVQGLFAEVAGQPETVINLQALAEGRQGEQRVMRQSYEVTWQGQVAYSGRLGAWYCPPAGRVYVVLHGRDPSMPSGDPEAALQQFLDSLVCHEVNQPARD